MDTNTKLTLVSVSCRGKTISVFLLLPIYQNVQGHDKAVCSGQNINKMLNSIDCYDRGLTFSVG